MKNKRLQYLSYIFLCLIFGSRLNFAQTVKSDSPPEVNAEQSPIGEENLIHFGDLIDVDVLGSSEYDWRGELNSDGFLQLATYNDTPVLGLCRDEKSIAADVAKSLGKFLREPKVVVRILSKANRPPAILYGAVKTPQRFRSNRPVFLNEIIVSAGGITERASGDIQIFRPKNLNCFDQKKTAEKQAAEKGGKYIDAAANSPSENDSQYLNIKISDLLKGKKEANPQILSGDIVTVAEADSVYVLGGVANPKQIMFRSQITISRAVASAGGLTKDALPDKITIFRRGKDETKIIEADLNKIKGNLSEDVVLQASDIVEVSQKGSGKRKYPPRVQTAQPTEKSASELPIRVID